MTMYVYATNGEPRGFLFETNIYSLEGAPLARLLGSRVHRFDGSYVGEWFHHMVVARTTAIARRIAPVPAPAPRAPAPCSPWRREVAEYRNFVDAFYLLLDENAAGRTYQEAAE